MTSGVVWTDAVPVGSRRRRAPPTARLGRFEVERADGESVRDTPLAKALVAAGFTPTYKGLRSRA